MGLGPSSSIFWTSLTIGWSMTELGGMVAIVSRQDPRNVPPSDSEAKYNHTMSNIGQGV